MPTPILPTKTQLATLAFTPQQLVADAEVEQYLTVTNNYDFVLQLMAQYRSGLPASWTGTGVTVTPALRPTHTEFVYFCSVVDLNQLINYLTHVDYGYGYVARVAKGTVWETRTAGIDISVSDDYIISTGAQLGKYALLVSWAQN